MNGRVLKVNLKSKLNLSDILLVNCNFICDPNLADKTQTLSAKIKIKTQSKILLHQSSSKF